MKKTILYSFLLILITISVASCETEIDRDTNGSKEQIKTDTISGINNPVELVDTVLVSKQFLTRLSKVEVKLLERLELCTGTIKNDSVDVLNPPCDGRLFRIFQLNKTIPENELFVVEIKKGIYGNQDNKLIVLAKIAEEYVELTSMAGYLLEFRKSDSKFDEFLALHVSHEDRVAFEMCYNWDAERRRYQPSLLEAVDGAAVRSEIQDSVTALAIEELKSKEIING